MHLYLGISKEMQKGTFKHMEIIQLTSGALFRLLCSQAFVIETIEKILRSCGHVMKFKYMLIKQNVKFAKKFHDTIIHLYFDSVILYEKIHDDCSQVC